MAMISNSAADRIQGRSMVISRGGIVASEHPLASQAGARILEEGGNAVDAAVAANAAMGVVAPMMCGIGGDLFVIIYDAKTGQLHGLNASGWSPAALSPEVIRKAGFTNAMPQAGIHSVTVPGAVDGWDKLLTRFGRKQFKDVLRPAISLAQDGFPVTELVHNAWKESEKLLQKDVSAAKTYLPGGAAPEVGALFRNPDLAWAYSQIARSGRRAYYQGQIADRLVSYSQSLGGTLTKADLQEYSSEWVTPISTTYRGWTVYEIPPNGQGIAALAMLNLMEQFSLGEFGHNSARALHALIESKKLAYADMHQHVADPRFAKVPVRQILSKTYAAERARLIDPAKANGTISSGVTANSGTDTTYLCVVDAEGNMVSYIQSNFNAFGSGLVAPGTGFALQNRGGLFSLDRAHPNILAGRKRPQHTIIPAFMEKENIRIAFGIMGGWNQSQAHAQFVSNLVDHHLNIQSALEAPRFTKLTFPGVDVQVERRVPEEVRKELAARGHQLTVIGSYAQAVWGGQAVMRDFQSRVNYGASDPRKDGAAVPELGPRRK